MEYAKLLAIGILHVLVIPAVTCSLVLEVMSWRKWLWKMSHQTMLNTRRSDSETCNILERMGWWPTLARDSADWFRQCTVCHAHRGTPMRPPTRSTAASDAMSALLPWQDVLIDVTGPFTRAEGGERCVLNYLCSKLRVPKLSVMKEIMTVMNIRQVSFGVIGDRKWLTSS